MATRALISKHITNPVNFGRVPKFTSSGAARGQLHGDFIAYQLLVHRGRIKQIRWTGTGCDLVLAVASMVAEAMEGKYLVVADAILANVLTGIQGYDAVCVEVVREAFYCCMDPGAHRGTCRKVTV
jgi:nitrogen fixation protein NifU and related proteins